MRASLPASSPLTYARPMPARLQAACPQFVVPDVVAAAEYYRDVLGFEIRGYFEKPPVFAIVMRDDVELHLGKSDGAPPAPNQARRRISVDVYVWVSDVDALHTELRGRGAKLIEAPNTKPYGCREMV